MRGGFRRASRRSFPDQPKTGKRQEVIWFLNLMVGRGLGVGLDRIPLLVGGVAVSGLLVVHAEGQADGMNLGAEANLSNLVSFVRGNWPVARAEVGVDGKYVGENGFTPSEPVFFEVARQTDTFFARQMWEIAAGRVVSVTNGPVYGANSIHVWIVKGSTAYTSRFENPVPEGPDPVRLEVKGFRQLAFAPLRLGFPVTWEPVDVLPGNRLLLEWRGPQEGKQVIADVQMGTNGLARTVSWRVTNSHLHAVVTLGYRYVEGNRPWWMPAFIESAASEVHLRSGKRLSYSDIVHIRECSLGHVDLDGGYRPEMFLVDAKAKATLAWTNGVGVRIEGTNVSVILPPDTPSAAGRSFGRRLPRWVVLSALLLSLPLLFLAWKDPRRLPPQ